MAIDDGADVSRAAKVYCWTFGNAEFDEVRWQLRVAGQDVELERKPLEVLQYLLRHAGEAVTKDELLSAAWAGRVVVEAVLTNAIGKLRRALVDEAQDIVMTLPRVGYRLAVPVSRKAVEFIPAASQLEVGSVVPRRPNWRLETPLARTGGNEVWLARHAKTRETRVFKFSLAGKGLHGLKREVTIARLLREALGERDDFVHVLDWDFEEAPYFIESEYGGLSLDQWPASGDIATVSLERKLALFVEAADAIGAAHGIGVLHKDLKPANLLVHGEGDEARMRVADFGSSRLFDSGRLDELGITHLGLTQTQAISTDSGTPLYLAPEVVAGQSATIKSDVYALGVTLYQLLVGDFRRQLSPGWENDIDDPLLRQDIADAANGDPAKRLESAAAFAERIRTLDARREKRALEMAVQARIADGEKRLAKARARRPWMIAAMVTLAAGLAISGSMWRKSEQQARVAMEQRDVAEKQARRADAVVNYLSNDLIQSITPTGKGFEQNPTIKELVEYASTNLDASFEDDAETRTSLHAAIAATLSALSEPERSAEHYKKAWRGYALEFGKDDELTLITQYDWARELVNANKFDEALSILDDADRLAGARIKGQNKLSMLSAWSRGTYYQKQYKVDEAEPLLRHAEQLQATVSPNDQLLGGRLRLALADIHQRRGNFTEVIAMMRNALSDPLVTSEALKDSYRYQLAKMLLFQRKLDEALPLSEMTAASTEKLYGVGSRMALVRYSQVASIHSAMEHCDKALEMKRRLWDQGVRKYGESDQDVMYVGSSLAGNEFKCGNKELGIALKKQIIDTQVRRFGEDYPEAHSGRFFLAGMLKKEKLYREALRVLEAIDPEKLAVSTSSPAAAHWINIERGDVLISLKEKARGRALISTAIEGAVKMGIAPDSKRLVDARKLLGN